MATYPRVALAGDHGITVEFGDRIDPGINDRVLAYVARVAQLHLPGVVELVPTYCAVTVYYDPAVADSPQLTHALQAAAREVPRRQAPRARVVEIPVLYGGTAGPDLEDVAALSGLSPREVTELHASVEYRVYMLGFSPGFPYLGIVPERIALPRLEAPRAHVPAGSVGLAGPQTGIYPQDSPGGWRLIGRTPLRLYDPMRPQPFLLEAGDRVRFLAISTADFARLTEDRPG